MKKKILISALLIITMGVTAHAGKDMVLTSGSLSMFKDANARIYAEWDYSRCMIEDTPVEQFLEQKGPDWQRDYPNEISAAESAFMVRFNKKNKKYAQLTDDPDDTKYKMVIYVDKFHYGSTGASVIFGGGLFTKKVGGASIEGQIEIQNIYTTETIATFDFDCQGNSGLGNEERRSSCYANVADNLAKLMGKGEDSKKSGHSLGRVKEKQPLVTATDVTDDEQETQNVEEKPSKASKQGKSSAKNKYLASSKQLDENDKAPAAEEKAKKGQKPTSGKKQATQKATEQKASGSQATSSQQANVILKNGSTVTGKIKSFDPLSQIVIVVAGHDVTIPMEKVDRVITSED